jgi:hypothetical protein
LGTDDDGILLWLNDRSAAATGYARDFLLNYNDPTASIDGKPVTSAGLYQLYAGAAAARLIGVDQSDPRVPDVIGIAQYGVVYTGKKSAKVGASAYRHYRRIQLLRQLHQPLRLQAVIVHRGHADDSGAKINDVPGP